MSLRALFTLLVCNFALFGGAGAFEGRDLRDDAGNDCDECCCDATPNQDGCCTPPPRA